MNKYLMKTINYQGWKIDIYQWFAKKRFEVTCYSPNGNKIDFSQVSQRCWFREEFAIDETKEFIDSMINEHSNNQRPLVNWEYFESSKTKQADFTKLAG